MSLRRFFYFWVLIFDSILNAAGSSVHFFFSRFVRLIAWSALFYAVISMMWSSSFSSLISFSFLSDRKRFLTVSRFCVFSRFLSDSNLSDRLCRLSMILDLSLGSFRKEAIV